MGRWWYALRFQYFKNVQFVKMKKLLLGIFLFSTAITNVAFAQLYFPPNTGTQWESTTPTQLGWCTAYIDSTIDFVGRNDSKALLILKNGKIVVEKYYGSFTADSFWYWASAGKSLTSCLVSIAVQENLLDLDTNTSIYLGEGWTSCTLAEENKIKVRDHIRMTTGLDDNVPDNGCTIDTCLQYKADAGSRWAYHNAPYTIIDDIITASTGQTLNGFHNSKLKTKIGMTGSFIPQGYNNVYVSTPRAMARFALLNLANGIWNGDSVLKNRQYLAEMKNSSQDFNLSYGYLWWLNGKASYMLPETQFVFNGSLMPNAPNDMYSALGKNGQIINVVPSQNLIVIRMGNVPKDLSPLPTAFNNDIWSYLQQAIGCATGINTSTKDLLQVFPNPTENRLYLQTERALEPSEIKIYSSIGVLQQVEVDVQNKYITVDHLVDGIYFLHYENTVQRFQKLSL